MSREQMRDQQIAVIRELGGDKLANWLTLRPEVADPRQQRWRQIRSGLSFGLAFGYTLPAVAWLGGQWWLCVPGFICSVIAAVVLRHRRREP